MKESKGKKKSIKKELLSHIEKDSKEFKVQLKDDVKLKKTIKSKMKTKGC